MKERVENLTSVTESLKESTADAIDRLEKAVRGRPEEKAPEEKAAEEKTPTPRRQRRKGE